MPTRRGGVTYLPENSGYNPNPAATALLGGFQGAGGFGGMADAFTAAYLRQQEIKRQDELQRRAQAESLLTAMGRGDLDPRFLVTDQGKALLATSGLDKNPAIAALVNSTGASVEGPQTQRVNPEYLKAQPSTPAPIPAGAQTLDEAVRFTRPRVAPNAPRLAPLATDTGIDVKGFPSKYGPGKKKFTLEDLQSEEFQRKLQQQRDVEAQRARMELGTEELKARQAVKLEAELNGPEVQIRKYNNALAAAKKANVDLETASYGGLTFLTPAAKTRQRRQLSDSDYAKHANFWDDYSTLNAHRYTSLLTIAGFKENQAGDLIFSSQVSPFESKSRLKSMLDAANENLRAGNEALRKKFFGLGLNPKDCPQVRELTERDIPRTNEEISNEAYQFAKAKLQGTDVRSLLSAVKTNADTSGSGGRIEGDYYIAPNGGKYHIEKRYADGSLDLERGYRVIAQK